MDRPLAVTVGEPAGIGPDILLLAWQKRRRDGLPPFLAFGDPAALARRAHDMGVSVPFAVSTPRDACATFDKALPVAPLSGPMRGVPGRPDVDDAPRVLEAIDRALELARRGDVAAIVTGPIQKKTLYDSGFRFSGHTDYLEARARALWPLAPELPPWRAVMMLAGPELMTVPVTVHISLCDVPRVLTQELIVDTALTVAEDLSKRFGISAPRIAVAGLNPHAGENGAIGVEEDDIVRPALTLLRDRGVDISGPWPADTLFHEEARSAYDCVLAMYHDQALIPVKTLAFHETVNVTLGLPFIRTSPDHGTALALAGTGTARTDSFAAALRMAAALAAPTSLP